MGISYISSFGAYLGFRAQGFGLRGFGFRAQGFGLRGFRAQGFGLRGFGFRVEASGSRASGLGFRASCSSLKGTT